MFRVDTIRRPRFNERDTFLMAATAKLESRLWEVEFVLKSRVD